jgi:hypothetical protein
MISDNIKINCISCYVTGNLSASFTADGTFNASQAFSSLEAEFSDVIHNFTAIVTNEIVNTTESDLKDLANGDFDAITLPTMPLNLTLDVAGIPQTQLQLNFSNFDLYVELETILSGPEYTINLYTSETPLGLAAGQEADLGVFFTVDLLLSVDFEIDILSGFHLKLDDGISLTLNLFDKNISTVQM